MENFSEITVAVIGALGMFILNDIKESVKNATKSVEKLNNNVAIILSRIEQHDDEIRENKVKLEQLSNHVQEIKQRI